MCRFIKKSWLAMAAALMLAVGCGTVSDGGGDTGKDTGAEVGKGLCRGFSPNAEVEHYGQMKKQICDERDGRRYPYVQVNDKTWLAENLNYETGVSACYGDNPANCEKLGRLYDWHTAATACPKGWHLPDAAEWKTLEELTALPKLKALSPLWAVTAGVPANTDDYGFSALPGGYYSVGAVSILITECWNGGCENHTTGQPIPDDYYRGGLDGFWWVNSEKVSDYAPVQNIMNSSDRFYPTVMAKKFLVSVRCVKDDAGTPAMAEYPVTPVTTSQPGPPREMREDIDAPAHKPTAPDISMALVKGGTFTMGCTEEQGDDCLEGHEVPTHQVTLSDFYIGKYEVTQKQWTAVMGGNPSYFRGDDLPVENIGWDDAQTFIAKLNLLTGKKYRLPTEAEWEYAARGGCKSRGYKYAGSDNIDEVAWYGAKGSRKTHPAGGKAPNELGIYDMSGNVWEWVSDLRHSWGYGPEPKTNPAAVSDISESPKNPLGPFPGPRRITRGGSWNVGDKYPDPKYCRVASRWGPPLNWRNSDIGLRLVLSAGKRVQDEDEGGDEQ